jgi:hypothetical protein
MGFEGSTGQMNRIHEGIRIMYKKEQFVSHLFSMQSILYLHNPYLHTQIHPSAVNNILAHLHPRYI